MRGAKRNRHDHTVRLGARIFFRQSSHGTISGPDASVHQDEAASDERFAGQPLVATIWSMGERVPWTFLSPVSPTAQRRLGCASLKHRTVGHSLRFLDLLRRKSALNDRFVMLSGRVLRLLEQGEPCVGFR